jgi:hypothetical protein
LARPTSRIAPGFGNPGNRRLLTMTDKITQVRIGKNLIGIGGLEEIFQGVAARVWISPEAAQKELLRQVAARNYVPREAREAYRRALWREYRRFRGEAVEPDAPAGLEIKVLGLGCAGCHQFYQRLVNFLATRGLEAELQYVTDPAQLQEYGIRAFPALLVNGRTVLAGRIPPPAELERLLEAQLIPT